MCRDTSRPFFSTTRHPPRPQRRRRGHGASRGVVAPKMSGVICATRIPAPVLPSWGPVLPAFRAGRLAGRLAAGVYGPARDCAPPGPAREVMPRGVLVGADRFAGTAASARRVVMRRLRPTRKRSESDSDVGSARLSGPLRPSPATRIDSASSLTAGSWLRESGPKIKWLPSTPAGPADFRVRPAGRPAAQAKSFGSFCCACAAAAASTAVLASSGCRDDWVRETRAG